MFNDTAVLPVLARTVMMTADAVGGVLTYALTLASELAKTGSKTHLALMGPKLRPEQEAVARAVPGLVLHESTHALEWMDDPWADIARATDWLKDLEKGIRPDIIHLNHYCHGAAGFTAPVLLVAHSCVLSWWEAVEGTSVPERYATYKQAVRRGLHAADAVIAASQSMRASLERHYGPLPRTAVIPNGLAAEPSQDCGNLVAAAWRHSLVRGRLAPARRLCGGGHAQFLSETFFALQDSRQLGKAAKRVLTRRGEVFSVDKVCAASPQRH
ncbi:MAG: glycosyltransferase [Myxococcales bacterium]|nr:glycosyltransferase [Myxococcales bacterium]